MIDWKKVERCWREYLNRVEKGDEKDNQALMTNREHRRLHMFLHSSEIQNRRVKEGTHPFLKLNYNYNLFLLLTSLSSGSYLLNNLLAQKTKFSSAQTLRKAIDAQIKRSGL